MSVNITVSNGQGITQAIKSKLQSDGVQLKNVKLADWQKVMDLVNQNQQQISKYNTANPNAKKDSIFTGGNDTSKIANQSNWKTDFKVNAGQTMEIDSGIFAQIKAILTGKETAPVEQKNKENNDAPAVPEKIDATPSKLSVSESDKKNPDKAKLSNTQQEAVTEQQIEAMGGKVISRSVDGENRKIAVVEIDGQKVRREINEDGTLGDTIAAVKTFGKNKYISGEFPSDTKVLTRTVNGNKDAQIGIYEDENGNKVRQLVEKDPLTGKTTLGENLVTVSTLGKNTYVTQSRFNAQVKEQLGLGVNDEIPPDLKVEYVSIGGQSSLVFKKDGHVMDQKSIQNYLKDYKANQYFDNDTQLKGWQEQLNKLSVKPDYDNMQMEGLDNLAIEQEETRQADVSNLTNGINNYKSVIKNWQDNQTVEIDGKQYSCMTSGDNKKYYISGTSMYTVGLDGKPDKEINILKNGMTADE